MLNNVSNVSNDSYKILQELNEEKVDTYLPIILYVGTSMVIGAVGNFVVYYIYYYKLKESVTNLLVCFLSGCDLFCCLICMPFEIIVLHFPLTFRSDIACRSIRVVVGMMVSMSANIIFLISIVRYFSVCRPLVQQICRGKAKRALVIMVIYSMALALPAFFVFGERRIQTRISGIFGYECYIAEGLINTYYPLAYYCTLLLSGSVTSVMLIVLYFLIGIKVWGHKTNIQDRTTETVINQTSNDCVWEDIVPDNVVEDMHLREPTRRRVSFSISNAVQHPQLNSGNVSRTNVIMWLITLLWIVSYLPCLVTITCEIVIKGFRASLSRTGDILFNVSIRSFYFNHAVNPFIYGMFNLRFRRELFIILEDMSRKCSFRRNR